MKQNRMAIGLLLVALLAGCGSSGHAEDFIAEGQRASAHEREGLQREAQSDPRVAQSQLDILSRDEITWSDYQEAMGHTYACLAEAGLAPELFVERHEGQDVMWISAYVDSEDGPDRNENCRHRYSFFVDHYWRFSPDAISWRLRWEEAKRGPLRECIEERTGVSLPADTSWVDLVMHDEVAIGDLDSDLNCVWRVHEEFANWDG